MAGGWGDRNVISKGYRASHYCDESILKLTVAMVAYIGDSIKNH